MPLGVLPPQLIMGDTSKGLITNVNYRIAPQNSVKHAVNVVFDEELGSAKVRKGCTILGSQVVAENNTINGLFYYQDSGTTNSQLVAAINIVGDATQSIHAYNGVSWSEVLTGDTAGLKTRFETFVNRVMRVNGTNAVKAWSGAGIWESGGGRLDLTNFPRGKFVKVYKDQVVTAGVSTALDTLYISSVPTSSTISWTSGNRTIRVNPEDGMGITGLGEISNLLIVFKDRAMYRWNNRSIEADIVTEVGCTSQESIAVGGELMFFYNPRGVWMTNGGQPVLISRRIKQWIENVASSFFDDVSGYCDGEYYYCSLGDITIDGTAYTNIVARYTLGTQEWTVFSYANEFRVFSLYVSSGAEQIVGGDTTARVLQIESSSLTDNGTNISYEIDSQDFDFGSKGILKQIGKKIMAYGLNPENVVVDVMIDGDKNKIYTLGHINKNIEQFIINQKLSGHFFNFRVRGVSSQNRHIFQGLEATGITLVDYQA